MNDPPNSPSSGQPAAARIGSLCVVGYRGRLPLTANMSRQPEDWGERPDPSSFASHTTHRVPVKRDSFRRVNHRCIDTYFQPLSQATVLQASDAGRRAVVLAPGCQVIADQARIRSVAGDAHDLLNCPSQLG